MKKKILNYLTSISITDFNKVIDCIRNEYEFEINSINDVVEFVFRSIEAHDWEIDEVKIIDMLIAWAD